MCSDDKSKLRQRLVWWVVATSREAMGSVKTFTSCCLVVAEIWWVRGAAGVTAGAEPGNANEAERNLNLVRSSFVGVRRRGAWRRAFYRGSHRTVFAVTLAVNA